MTRPIEAGRDSVGATFAPHAIVVNWLATPRSIVALLALLLPAVTFLAWRGGAIGSGGSAVEASRLLAAVAALAGGTALLVARRREGAARGAWLILSGGAAAWAAGSLALASGEFAIEDGLVAFVALHAGWAGLAAALTSGIFLLGAPRQDVETRRKLVLDLMPTFIALLVVVWLAVVGTSALGADRGAWPRAAAALHGSCGLLLLAVALIGLLSKSHGPASAPVRWLSASAGVLATADLLSVQLGAAAPSSASVPAQTGLLVGLVGLLLAAVLELLPRAERAEPARGALGTASESDRVASDQWLQQVPHLCLIALLSLALGQRIRGELQPYGVETAIAGSLAVIVFVAIRQAISLRHTHRLHGEIGQLNVQIDGLIQQVGRDPLTGLFNRRAVQERLDRELTLGKSIGQPVAIALIDVDNFKTVNDTLGHSAGDRVLLAIGSILTAACRTTDVAARYAGDEFLLLLPGVDEADATDVCERIIARVRTLADELDLSGVRVSLSVGAAVTHHCRRTATQLIAIADAAMYDAKEGGKDRAVVVDADTLAPVGAVVEMAPTELRPYSPFAFIRPASERRTPRTGAVEERAS